MHHFTPIAVSLAALLVLPGCLVMSANEKTIGRRAARVAIDFESQPGLIAFTQEVDRRYPDQRVVRQSAFAIPFIVAASNTKVLSENAFFNEQVEQADLNDDSVLSDAEVAGYTGQPVHVEEPQEPANPISTDPA